MHIFAQTEKEENRHQEKKADSKFYLDALKVNYLFTLTYIL